MQENHSQAWRPLQTISLSAGWLQGGPQKSPPLLGENNWLTKSVRSSRAINSLVKAPCSPADSGTGNPFSREVSVGLDFAVPRKTHQLQCPE